MTADISPGFREPVRQAQQCFRAALDALSRPGRLTAVDGDGPAAPGLGQAATALLLSLADFETPVWLDSRAAVAGEYVRFHCGSPLTGQRSAAAIACCAKPADALPFTDFSLGTDLAPETSTTLIVEVSALCDGGRFAFSGPGVRDVHRLDIRGLPADWLAARAALAPLFPCGIDIFLTAGNRLCGLPRTTAVEEVPCTSR